MLLQQKSISKTHGMQVHKIPFDEVPQFSIKDVTYATAHPKLRPFYKYEVKLDSFKDVINDKKRDHIDRVTLVEALKQQYQSINTTRQVKRNIESLLSDQTFTVTTAHQPALFTGPFYYVLKIFSTINLATQLNEAYPEYHFVPVFVNGAEDHDFEEINHTTIKGELLQWNAPAGGSVGQLSTKSLTLALGHLKEVLDNSVNGKRLFQVIKDAYTQNMIYGAATNQLVNELFKDYGLVVLDMGAASLKRKFIPFLEKEIFEGASKPKVEDTQERLKSIDYPPQAYVRDYNVFYTRPGIRARIERAYNGSYYVVNTDYTFTEEALRTELQEHPERFSPNVVMRPIYQELILPNLAYIGGGGEIAYWLERKSQFEHFGINFPMLIRRNSALWVPHQLSKKIKKLGISIPELFMEEERLVQHFVEKNSKNQLNLREELQTLEEVFKTYSEKAKKVDATLEPRALAIGAKYRNSIEKLAKRLMRLEKKKFEEEIEQIRWIKRSLFPKNGLQERKHNFINFYLHNGDFLFETLKENLNPLDNQMQIFLED